MWRVRTDDRPEGLKTAGEWTMWVPEGRMFWSEGRAHKPGLRRTAAGEGGNTREASKPGVQGGGEDREVVGMELGGIEWPLGLQLHSLA